MFTVHCRPSWLIMKARREPNQQQPGPGTLVFQVRCATTAADHSRRHYPVIDANSSNGRWSHSSALITTDFTTAPPHLVPHFNGFPEQPRCCRCLHRDSARGMRSGPWKRLQTGGAPQWLWLCMVRYGTRRRNREGRAVIAFVFGLSILFLVLAAQFESWTLPVSVMTAVPFGILGALVSKFNFAVWKTMSTFRSAFWC